MRKFLLVLLALAFVMAGLSVCFAASQYSPNYANAIIIDGSGQVNQPPMFIKKVRYGLEGAVTEGLSSGDVVMWDTTSADGFTVSALVGTTYPVNAIAGVLVTALLTQDVGGTGDVLDDNYGYMAVGGYCLANIDVSLSTNGVGIVPSNEVIGYLGTYDKVLISQDTAGTILFTPAGDGKGKVWLNLN